MPCLRSFLLLLFSQGQLTISRRHLASSRDLMSCTCSKNTPSLFDFVCHLYAVCMPSSISNRIYPGTTVRRHEVKRISTQELHLHCVINKNTCPGNWWFTIHATNCNIHHIMFNSSLKCCETPMLQFHIAMIASMDVRFKWKLKHLACQHIENGELKERDLRA